jgi:putative transposase
VPTWAGVAYVCFIIDAFSRMIVGWRVAGHMRTDMVLDAVDMARWQRGTRIDGLRCHSDAGSQFTSVRYGEALAELGAVPSIGTVGDSFDCEHDGVAVQAGLTLVSNDFVSLR